MKLCFQGELKNNLVNNIKKTRLFWENRWADNNSSLWSSIQGWIQDFSWGMVPTLGFQNQWGTFPQMNKGVCFWRNVVLCQWVVLHDKSALSTELIMIMWIGHCKEIWKLNLYLTVANSHYQSSWKKQFILCFPNVGTYTIQLPLSIGHLFTMATFLSWQTVHTFFLLWSHSPFQNGNGH